MKNDTPSELVAILDKTIIGQDEAKQAIAIAFRDRFRRTQLMPMYKKWVPIRNVLLKGPSGTSKTEMARLIADICDFPFVKIDATALTSSGYVGGKVSTSLRQLVKDGERMYSRVLKDYQKTQAKEEEDFPDDAELLKILAKLETDLQKGRKTKKVKEVIHKYITAILGYIETGELEFKGTFESKDWSKEYLGSFSMKSTLHLVDAKDKDGNLIPRNEVIAALIGTALILWEKMSQPCIASDVSDKGDIDGYMNVVTDIFKSYFDNYDTDMRGIIEKHAVCELDQIGKKREIDLDNLSSLTDFGGIDFFGDRYKHAAKFANMDFDLQLLGDDYIHKAGSKKKRSTLPPELKSPRTFVENYSVVFIDEIDKLIPIDKGKGSVNTTEVQYELLKVIEGAKINLDGDRFSGREDTLGLLDTQNILFICAGAFVNTSQDGLISELRGRLPIVINLHPLKEEHLYRILTESNKSPLLAIEKLLAADKIKVKFTDEALHAVAKLAERYNELDEDLGARRLTTILSIVLSTAAYDIGSGDDWVDLNITAEDVGREIERFYNDNYHLYRIDTESHHTMAEWEKFIRVDPNSPIHVGRIKRIHNGDVKDFSHQTYRVLAACIYLLAVNGNGDRDKYVNGVFDSLYEIEGPIGDLINYVRTNIEQFLPKVVTSDMRAVLNEEDEKAIAVLGNLVGVDWLKEKTEGKFEKEK